MSVKEYPNASRIYVDLDGPVADFDRRFRELGVNPSEMKLQPGIYESLDVTPGAVNGMRLLARLGCQVWFMTKIPDENLLAATEKLKWVASHFPDIRERTIITPDKGAVGTDYDFLIDDHPEWANANNFPGSVVKFDKSLDDTVAEWERVVSYIAAASYYKTMFTYAAVYFIDTGGPEEAETLELYEKSGDQAGGEIDYGMTKEEYQEVLTTRKFPASFISDVLLLRNWTARHQKYPE